MTRTLTTGMQSAIAAQRGTIAYFIMINPSGGTIYLTTAPCDINWNLITWDGIGGVLNFTAVEESPDPAAQGVELTLSGVNQTIISILMNNHVRGRAVQIWLAHINDSGQVVSDPLEIFRGHQNSDYRIQEVRRTSPAAGTVTVKTRLVSRLAPLARPLPIRANVISHQDMLKRAGLPTSDTFFANVAAIAGKQIHWGSVVKAGGAGWTPPSRDYS